jgi:hypothetical protein
MKLPSVAESYGEDTFVAACPAVDREVHLGLQTAGYIVASALHEEGGDGGMM